jgi:biopolymer transport protein ExbD
MAFTTGSGGGPMADINVTPLVDVMLVLLIIFMVTAPPLSTPIAVDLPQPSNIPPDENLREIDPIKIRIDASGTVNMNGNIVDMRTLSAEFAVQGALDLKEQAKVEIETDPEAEYETLARVLARAKNEGLAKIMFVEPEL